MTDYAAQVQQLYRHYGTWRKVADACGESVEQRGVYWDIAHKKYNPSKKRRIAILKAVKSLGAPSYDKTRTLARLQRKNVSFAIDTYKRLESLKNAQGLTWNELAEMLLERME